MILRNLIPALTLCALPSLATALQAIPEGWFFTPHTQGKTLQAHTDQIGTLNQLEPNSTFVSVPVISRRAVGISERTGSAQLIRLEAEVNAVMHREKSKPRSVSKKIVNERGVYEAEYGRSGKGFTWVYASTIGDTVVVLIGVSREMKPAKSARDDFFKMARAFSP